MPNIKSAIKRVKTNETKTAANKKVKKMYREAVKAFEQAVTDGAKDVNDLLVKATSSVDKAWSKGVIKKNTADRKKSNMAKKIAKK